jgi:hypothetical protein
LDPAYDPQSWQNFFVMAGGSAAALTGLLFVAMSMHAKTIMGSRFYRTRAIGTLVSLTTQLVLAAAVLVPGQSLTVLGIEVEAGALLFVGISIWAAAFRGSSVPLPRPRRIAEVSFGLVLIAFFVGSGVSLLIQSGGGLYLMAVAMLMSFGWNIYVAWVLISEVSE